MKRILLTMLVALGASLAAPAFSAPFCVQGQGLPAMCDYDDVQQCRTRANELNGQCVLNTAEFKLETRQERYCVVDSFKSALCIYVDRSSCAEDAARKGAVCIEVYPSDIKDDPYRFDPARKY